MRNRFDEQLQRLNEELTDMGELCVEAISAALKTLFEDSQKEREHARDTECEIDRKERTIEDLCLKLLLQQQPVARDLRIISSALKMISDMERIGDQASDIAEITEYITDRETESKLHIRDMTEAVIHMVTESVKSFVMKDLTLANDVIKYDDVVDALFDKVRNELITLLSNKYSDGEFCIDLLMIAKYLERIGDHATNIAEWVVFSITGKHVTD